MRHTPSQVTYNILVAGTTPRDTKELEEIHEKFKSSNLSLTPELCSSLIAALPESTLKNAQNTFQKRVLMLIYGYRSEYSRAKEIFNSIKNKDVDVWNCYLRVLTRGGNGQASITALETMISDGVEPDNLSYNQVISVCGHRFMVN
jgi:pentatricopeptide repeat protein